MKILIVKTSAIGDVIHTLPALNCLRRHYPEARIDWLVEEAAAEAVIGHRAVDRVLVSRRKSWIKFIKSGRFLAAGRDFYRLWHDLRATRYDLLLDFQGLLKSGIFVFGARARRKVGFGPGMEHAEASWLFLNERLPPVAMDQHAIQRELQLLAAIGIPCQDVVFDFPVRDEDQNQVRRLLAKLGADPSEPMVAINPLTTWPTKHWLNERFAAVADRLGEMGVKVVFTGGLGEAPVIAEKIIASMRHRDKAINLAGRTSLKELAALYGMVQAVITTDTGPMHVAAAVGTPVVALFGPTAPWRTGPYGDKHRVLRAGLACSPCFKRECQGHEMNCMKNITLDEVLTAVSLFLH
ncbi:MAG: lipopolysaccharide heptosyltransferase I [Desulfobacteraceae bacterium]|nr:lipopolysaccharide heptosyltransferase I [Desulfobacteraceae bacterium]